MTVEKPMMPDVKDEWSVRWLRCNQTETWGLQTWRVNWWAAYVSKMGDLHRSSPYRKTQPTPAKKNKKNKTAFTGETDMVILVIHPLFDRPSWRCLEPERALGFPGGGRGRCSLEKGALKGSAAHFFWQMRSDKNIAKPSEDWFGDEVLVQSRWSERVMLWLGCEGRV